MVHRAQHRYGRIARNYDRDKCCSRGNFNLGRDLLIPVIDAMNDLSTK